MATKTFGTLEYRLGQWRLQVEPHVAIRVKRFFPKLARQHQEIITMADSADTSADLEWLMLRYPLEMTAETRALLEARASGHRALAERVADLMGGYAPPRPFKLAHPLREYQQLAAELGLSVPGLLIADQVGLGKTSMAIGVISDPSSLPALVVTLAHLPGQWEDEFRKFAPNLRTHILQKGTPYDLRGLGKDKDQLPLLDDSFPDVIITNYHKLRGWSDTLRGKMKTVICDEAQELRRNTSEKWAAAAAIAEKAERRIGLSATPIYGYGAEIHNVFGVLRPGALGTRAEFVEEWCTGTPGRESVRDPKALGTYLREQGLMILRTRRDVNRELPAISIIPHRIDSDPEALNKVSREAEELARLILSLNEKRRGEQWQASEYLTNMLRQATGIAKAGYVADFVSLLVAAGERVVLFAWHRMVYDILMERLRPLNPVLYTGSESSNQKAAAKQAFVSGRSQVLIMSLRAGAGLDGLQHACRTVVFGELDWSPQVHLQNIGRVARDGQPDPVAAYYLLASDGCDPAMEQVLGLKKAQWDGIKAPLDTMEDPLAEGTVDVDRVRSLAESFLKQRGVKLPMPAAEGV